MLLLLHTILYLLLIFTILMQILLIYYTTSLSFADSNMITKLDRELAELIYQAFAEKIHLIDDLHPMAAYFLANKLERHTLVNNPRMNRVLVVDINKTISVISFLSIIVDSIY